jgi:TrkA domain protein
MTQVEETRLPGVGIRHEFTTQAGRRLGLLTHISGRRELLVYDAGDPDTTAETVGLGVDDARVLAELLGADQVTEHVGGVKQSVRAQEIDWLSVERGSPSAGRTLGELGLGAAEGLTPIAVLRGPETVSSPGNEFALAEGDTVVVAGSPDAIRGVLQRLSGA